MDLSNNRRGIYPPRTTNLSLAKQVMFAQQLEPHFVGSETVHFLDPPSILAHIDMISSIDSGSRIITTRRVGEWRGRSILSQFFNSVP